MPGAIVVAPTVREVMARRVLRVLEKKYEETEDDVDFLELSGAVDGFSGEFMWMLAENLTAWPALSEDAAHVMHALLTGRKIKLYGTSHMHYLRQGVKSGLRLAASVRPCAELTWLPCTVGQGPVK